MTHRLFEEKHHASLYQKYRFVPPEPLKELILQYLDNKKGQPHVLAVDLGCGTGQNSRLLAPYFQEVVGIDISECQLEQARAVPGFPNVTYRVGSAEELPFEDSSVDLLTAASAAHWFNQERFLKEAVRTLRPRGCMALLGYTDNLGLHYGSCGDRLNCIFEEVKTFLSPYVSTPVAVANTKLQDLFDAIPFPDKERIESIEERKRLSVSSLVGFVESFSYYQSYLRADPEAATSLLQNMQSRFLEEMGVSSPDTEVEVQLKYFCVLACKPQ
ncbi:putative methyltransferase DDB_G0268948 isoform X2 [Megalops cyprinoides]|uniref:putative methyltransferase DDB_G0268948 isoform X2 n=1 Tax=Megalops cyprinoides TaxID=118141 RepID=UPI0018651CC2|nr:putative methyltransferase DDB_G0268948 isoform X2 [Megalops cyprinoides]